MEKKNLFSETLKGAGRTYFFDLKETSQGKPYLIITESHKNQQGEFEKVRLYLFSEDFEKFGEMLNKATAQATNTETVDETA
jgi:hypothetical protein